MASKNNWFTTNLAERTKDNVYDFKTTISPYKLTTGTFKDNCLRSVKELYEIYGKLYVSYSGGMDSEFILSLFYELNIPVTPIIVSTPYNTIESKYAFEFCSNRSLRPEVLSLSKVDFIDKLNLVSCARGFFALLGGLPLLIHEEVKSTVLTGYGDPFTVSGPYSDIIKNNSEILEHSEWDFYLEAVCPSQPSGFFTYDQDVFYSLINEIRYDIPLQQAKHELYKVPYRDKMYWDIEFYNIFREILNKTDLRKFKYNELINKIELCTLLER